VTVVAFGNVPPALDEGVKIVRTKATSIHWYIKKIPWVGDQIFLAFREIEWSWSIYKLIQKLNYQKPFDIIEATETCSLFLSLVPIAPLIVRLHGEEYTYRKYAPHYKPRVADLLRRFLQRLAIKKATLLISPSMAHANEIKSEIKDIKKKVEIIHNPQTLYAMTGLNITDEELIKKQIDNLILMVARLQPHKGLDILFNGLPKIIKEIPNAQVVIVGPSHPHFPMPEIQKLVHQLQLTERVIFAGEIHGQELIQLYCKAAVFVLPSYYEAFGMVCLEAMAFGLPVVASNRGGIPEVMENGQCGFTFAIEDKAAFSDAVITVLKNKKLRSVFSKNARKRAGLFTLKEHTNKSLQAYNSVCHLIESKEKACPEQKNV
jgi:glycosyltransferase involved in cell wall biosynthesis